MAAFLGNYIQSLTTRQQSRVADLFSMAIEGKSDLTNLAALLTGKTNFGSVLLNNMPAQGRLSASDWQLNIRHINTLFQELFSTANEVGTLLEQNSILMNSQVSALEKQISSLEKQIANYQFLIADGGTYNYAYIETFHDTLGQETPPWQVPDRDGNAFDPALQAATVLTDEGAIVLPDNSATNLALTATLYSSNINPYITSDTGIENILSPSSQTGWRIATSCPTPITASLPDPYYAGHLGAQAVVEVFLGQPQAVNSVKLVPLTSNSLEVVQIVGFSTQSDQVGTPLLSQTVNLTQANTIHFPVTNVQRVRIYLNQPTYTRQVSYATPAESSYRQMSTAPSRGESYIRYQGTIESFSHLPNYSLASKSQYVPEIVPQILQNKTRVGPGDFWTQYNAYESSFYSLFSQWPGIFKAIFANSITSSNYNAALLGQLTPSSTNVAPAPSTALPAVVASSIQNSQDYEYTIGLQSLSLGIDVPAYKGYFLSTVIPSPGDMGEVRMRVQDSNYSAPSSSLDDPILTSVEYSVTNSSYPTEESDWVPILPANLASASSERLFPDKSGNCAFRFVASPHESITIYKNGLISTDYVTSYDNTNNNLIGVQLLPGTYTANDILTASYMPSGNPYVVDFSSNGFDNVPLVAASDSNGSGEGFLGTGGGNTVQLSQVPYINPSNGASSITVILADGTTVTNATNYSSRGHSAFPSMPGYYFIQSGNTIIFNQAITQSFRVYYQYLQNNVRFRVVLRVDSTTFVSPKVNSVQIKAQIRVSNSQQSI